MPHYTPIEHPRAYNIVRFYQRGTAPGYATRRRVIIARVTLAEAQAHCADPETSSSTCTTAVGRRRTRQRGPWFDGYEER